MVRETAWVLGGPKGAAARLGMKRSTLHSAFASRAKAEYFCTCDDRLLKKSKRLKTLATKVVSPLELIAEIAQ